MSLYCIIIIMFATGIFGGIVNFFSDANAQKEPESTIVNKLRPVGVCILFGLAATVLVPLFLKFADSNLLQEIYIPKKENPADNKPVKQAIPKAANYSSVKSDSIQSTPSNTGASATGKTDPKEPASNKNPEEKATDYLIWTAYCLLAACAGMRFIDLLINKFLTQAQMTKLVEENNKTKKENDKLEVVVEKAVKLDEKRKKNLEISEREIVDKLNIASLNIEGTHIEYVLNNEKLPVLPPIKFADDPQKGRFGGKSSSNGRTLSVSYERYLLSDFLKLTIKVSTDNDDDKLKGNVYLFLHDSFADSVVMNLANGKTEITHEVISYGAFTIGAVADNGNTFLELDLAELENFPEDFRNR